jgi:hypothetical protein
MSQYEIDYLMMKAYRIGSLVMHLAARAYYQVLLETEFNAEEKKKWDTALDLDKGGRDDLKGHDIHWLLFIFIIKLEQNHSLLKEMMLGLLKSKTIWCPKSYCWSHVS